MQWATSSYSVTDCVEVAHTRGHVHVRDSKHREGPALAISLREWRTVLKALT